MSEDEAKKELFNINHEYMSHSKEERVKLYNEYINKRNQIKEELIKYISENKTNKTL